MSKYASKAEILVKASIYRLQKQITWHFYLIIRKSTISHLIDMKFIS